jgi:hypothetical protein
MDVEAPDGFVHRMRGVHGVPPTAKRRSRRAAQRLLIVDEENCRHTSLELWTHPAEQREHPARRCRAVKRAALA